MVREGLVLVLGLAFVGARLSRNRQSGRVATSRPGSADALPGDDLRDRFLATVSHELRTPLNAIIGWVQILKAGLLKPGEIAHALDAIERNAQAQARMVADLLDISKMRQARLILKRTPVDLSRLVSDAARAVRSSFEAKRLIFTADCCPGLVVLGDASRLRQLVHHLLANASKCTPGGRHVGVSVQPAGAMIELKVTDEGIGIAPQELPRIFEPFYQAPATGVRTGLGLGLALASEIVELHGGAITVETGGVNRGTTVTVQLPASHALPAA